MTETELRALLNLALKELDALEAKTVPAQIRNALSALEPSPIHKGEARAWEAYWPGAGSENSLTRITMHRHEMEAWRADGAEISPLYTSPFSLSVTITDALTAARGMIAIREHIDELSWGKGASPATPILKKINAALAALSCGN